MPYEYIEPSNIINLWHQDRDADQMMYLHQVKNVAYEKTNDRITAFVMPRKNCYPDLMFLEINRLCIEHDDVKYAINALVYLNGKWQGVYEDAYLISVEEIKKDLVLNHSAGISSEANNDIQNVIEKFVSELDENGRLEKYGHR